MSYSDYLWTIARTLRTRVQSDVRSDDGRETVQNCVRVLTALANALERDAQAMPQRPEYGQQLAPRCSIRDAIGPPENAGLYLATEPAIAEISARIDSDAETDLSALRESIGWEHQLLGAAINRMDAVETAAAQVFTDAALHIDPERLQLYLRRRTGEGDLTIKEFRPALGGRSRQTALFSVNAVSGIVPRLVVQRALPGMSKSAAFCGPEVEYRVLDTLHRAGLKVPRPLFLETDQEALGGPFIIAEQSSGRLVQPDYWAPPQSAAVALQLAEQMARLHSQPLEPLAAVLPRSRARADRQAWIEELDRLNALWHAQAHGPSITMSAAIAWLRANVDCVEDRQSLVHNDMVFHNILAEGDQITAILDWEQTSVGHPAEDLGYCYPVVSAVMDWQRFMAAYREAGGAPLPQRQIDYFSLRAILRLMTLVQQGRDAFESGATRDVLIAGAGAFFAQRLMQRLSQVLDGVLTRAAAD